MFRVLLGGFIVFMSDFGLNDPYVGQVKAVLYRIASSPKIVDLTHMIEPFCIVCGSYVLFSSYNWFPERSVFLSVIDPGVGGSRRPIAVFSRKRFFVGPDNGLFWEIVKGDPSSKVVVIDSEKAGLSVVSSTFHGRDLFAPAAAMLYNGFPIEELGDPLDIEDMVKLDLIFLEERDGKTCFNIVYSDRFGNLALSATKEHFSIGEDVEKITLYYGGRKYPLIVTDTFSKTRKGELSLYYNSFGFLEIAEYMGSARKRIGARIGERVCLEIT